MNKTDLENWKSKGKYFVYKNYQIFYQQEGKGEILVLIHGFPTSSFDWLKIWEELTQKFTVIAPDMLGFGFSDKPHSYTYSIHDQASLHEELLDSLDITSVHLLSHDYGDTVAQELLARFEERKKEGEKGVEIKSLCLLNGGIFPEMHRPRLVQKLLNSPIGFIITQLMNRKRFAKGFSEVFGPESQPNEEELDAFWELIRYKKGHRIGHKLIKYIEDRKKHRDRWVNALIHTHIPLQLINGPTDPVSGLHAAERYKELIPNPDIILLDKIGHYPQVENPEGVLKAYFEFVRRISL